MGAARPLNIHQGSFLERHWNIIEATLERHGSDIEATFKRYSSDITATIDKATKANHHLHNSNTQPRLGNYLIPVGGAFRESTFSVIVSMSKFQNPMNLMS